MPNEWINPYIKTNIGVGVPIADIPALLAEAVRRREGKLREKIEELDKRFTYNPDEIHCSCWPCAKDILLKDLCSTSSSLGETQSKP
jgi:hypothetical protein